MTKFSDFINDFLNIFPTLSKFYKEIFKYLHWHSRKWRCVYPGIDRIANKVGCSRSTVKRATAFFQKIGWLVKIKCHYQSNQYFLNNEIIYLNLDDSSIFFREEIPQNEPVLLVSSSDINKYIGTSENKVPTYMNKLKKNPVPLCIKIQCLNGQQQEFLAQNFPEQTLLEAVNDAKWYRRQGKIIKSYFGLIYSRAKAYFK